MLSPAFDPFLVNNNKLYWHWHVHREQKKRKCKWSALVFPKCKRNHRDNVGGFSYDLLSSSALN